MQYLIKLGEIHLKEGNRQHFIDRLKQDLKRRLAGVRTVIIARDGRFYLELPEEAAARAERELARTPGINGWARTLSCPKSWEAIVATAVEAIRERVEAGARSFKVEARRADKSFAYDSSGIARELGAAILAAYPALAVDVHTPACVVYVEIREQAFVYTDGQRGIRGLPVGSAGKGLLLLSGGIDSPVAGYLMATRGMALEAVHFASYPYTSREAWEKVRDLSAIVAGYAGPVTLHTVQMTDIQLALKKNGREECTTLYLRAAMVLAATLLAAERDIPALVSGESLSQVASQTAENMRFTGSYTDRPVFRPLVGTDKEETVRIARAIGSYETSILPYEDCCVLWSPKHPVLRAEFERERAGFASLGLENAIAAAVAARETVVIEPAP